MQRNRDTKKLLVSHEVARDQHEEMAATWCVAAAIWALVVPTTAFAPGVAPLGSMKTLSTQSPRLRKVT